MIPYVDNYGRNALNRMPSGKLIRLQRAPRHSIVLEAPPPGPPVPLPGIDYEPRGPNVAGWLLAATILLCLVAWTVR